MSDRKPVPPACLADAALRLKAVNLRLAGWGYQAIAEEMGLTSPGVAENLLAAEMEAHRSQMAEQVREIEDARLDGLLRAHYPTATGKSRGAVAAGLLVLKIMERRAKLHGLDAPTKVAPTDPTGEQEWGALDPAAQAKAIAELLAKGLERAQAATSTDGEPAGAETGE